MKSVFVFSNKVIFQTNLCSPHRKKNLKKNIAKNIHWSTFAAISYNVHINMTAECYLLPFLTVNVFRIAMWVKHLRNLNLYKSIF